MTNNVKIYTHYSKSHEIFYKEYFNPSLRRYYNTDEVTIRLAEQQQYTSNGVFMERGWLDAMEEKIQIILKAIEENRNGWFVFSDCDIQFFGRFLDVINKEMNDKSIDIVGQEDIETICAGFFACKGSAKMKEIFTEVLRTFRTVGNDQAALNKLRPEFNYKYLDGNQFYTIGNELKQIVPPVWRSNSNYTPKVPGGILMHHANFVVGLEDKIKLMKLVKQIVEDRHENMV